MNGAPDLSPLLCRAIPDTRGDEPAFPEPWQARAFAMVVALSEAGHFTWAEWVDCFSRHVARAAQAEPARSYYEQWMDAAEELLVTKGLTSREQLFAKRLEAIVAPSSHPVPKPDTR